MVVAIGQQIGLQFAVIRQLAIEAKAEPFVLLQMMPLERLRIIPIVLATSGVTHMADRRAARALVHQAFVLAAMAHSEHFAHAADIFVREQQLLPLGVVRGNSGRQLPAVLNIQQHPRHEPGNFLRTMWAAQRIGGPARKMINGRHSAFVMKFAHSSFADAKRGLAVR